MRKFQISTQDQTSRYDLTRTVDYVERTSNMTAGLEVSSASPPNCTIFKNSQTVTVEEQRHPDGKRFFMIDDREYREKW